MYIEYNIEGWNKSQFLLTVRIGRIRLYSCDSPIGGLRVGAGQFLWCFGLQKTVIRQYFHDLTFASAQIEYNRFLLMTIDDFCAWGGQNIGFTSNNRLLQIKTSQELTVTNTEATYRWITYTIYKRVLLQENIRPTASLLTTVELLVAWIG